MIVKLPTNKTPENKTAIDARKKAYSHSLKNRLIGRQGKG